ncbi:hypothetical protein EUGRSUZ_B01805 [Eucalyptus grandis]|uniref:Uncharacterized protein n=2 Tax=Eucalyptus grandis TaxID=71139 RepID=A0ACC3LR95_EUCGR|nr:hypothetical protein EUGRSUZ_B01805 [Eucalyptus grandis]
MTPLAYPVVLSIVVTTFLTCAWQILWFLWLKPRKVERFLRQQGLNGTPYSLLFRDFREMARMIKQARPITPFSNDIAPFAFPFVHHNMEKYGKLFFTWIGPRPVLNIMDSDMLKEIFSRIYEFEKPRLKALGDVFLYGLLNIEGEKWATHRKIMDPAFHLEKLKVMVSPLPFSAREMMRTWEEQSVGGEVDVWPHLERMSSNVISRAVLGSSYEQDKRIFVLQKKLMRLAIKASQFAWIPGSSFLPTTMRKRMSKIDRELKSFLKDMVIAREKALKEGGAEEEDLLGSILKSNRKEIEKSGQQNGMSVEDVVQECKFFYLSGQDTTTLFLTWTMILLSKYKNWQERAREEVLQVFGDKKPDFEGLSRLKMVSMILNEVIRLYGTVPLTLRTVYETTKLGHIQIPAGVQLYVPLLLIHRDQDRWGDDANEFNPERFSVGASTATKNELAFLPFGYGPRTCIARNYVLLEAKAVLAMVLQNFSMELSPSYKHAPTPLISLKPQYGAPLVLTRIKPNLPFGT